MSLACFLLFQTKKNKNMLDSFFQSFFGSNNEQTLEDTIKRMEQLKQKYGGEVKVTEELIKRVTVSHISEDGGITSQVIMVVDDSKETQPTKEVDMTERLIELKRSLKASLENEDYEKCAEIKKQIEELEQNGKPE
jgi:excinuclease UvrABC helicase subunit UvrB